MAFLSLKSTASLPVRQRGISIIELMVATTISMILLGAIANIVTSANNGYRELHRSNEQMENGRVALQLLSDDLQHAGFFGEEFPTITTAPATLPDPCAITDLPINSGLALPVAGNNDVTTTTSLPSCIPAANLVDNTDILTIRRAATQTTDINNNNQIDDGELNDGAYYLQANNNEFYANKGTDSAASDNVTFDLTAKDGATQAAIRALEVHTYYIARCNICAGANADTIPTLKRQELTYESTAPVMKEVPLVEGIEQLQIAYGIDSDGDGAADYYQHAGNLDNASPALTTNANWLNVVAVKLDIVSRNREASAGYQDTKSYTLGSYGSWTPATTSYKRRAYTITVRLENISGRRER